MGQALVLPLNPYLKLAWAIVVGRIWPCEGQTGGYRHKASKYSVASAKKTATSKSRLRLLKVTVIINSRF